MRAITVRSTLEGIYRHNTEVTKVTDPEDIRKTLDALALNIEKEFTTLYVTPETVWGCAEFDPYSGSILFNLMTYKEVTK